jgi:hypothetical protein
MVEVYKVKLQAHRLKWFSPWMTSQKLSISAMVLTTTNIPLQFTRKWPFMPVMWWCVMSLGFTLYIPNICNLTVIDVSARWHLQNLTAPYNVMDADFAHTARKNVRYSPTTTTVKLLHLPDSHHKKNLITDEEAVKEIMIEKELSWVCWALAIFYNWVRSARYGRSIFFKWLKKLNMHRNEEL